MLLGYRAFFDPLLPPEKKEEDDRVFILTIVTYGAAITFMQPRDPRATKSSSSMELESRWFVS